MATGIPVPPTRADAGEFAWTSWYNQLYTYLKSSGAIAWASIDKTGSSIADLQNHNHNLLTSMQGGAAGEYYHLNAAQQAKVAGFLTKAGDPTTTDISSGNWAIYKNTSTGAVKLWANDGGTMKSVILV